jgi:hypothetical protein
MSIPQKVSILLGKLLRRMSPSVACSTLSIEGQAGGGKEQEGELSIRQHCKIHTRSRASLLVWGFYPPCIYAVALATFRKLEKQTKPLEDSK